MSAARSRGDGAPLPGGSARTRTPPAWTFMMSSASRTLSRPASIADTNSSITPEDACCASSFVCILSSAYSTFVPSALTTCRNTAGRRKASLCPSRSRVPSRCIPRRSASSSSSRSPVRRLRSSAPPRSCRPPLSGGRRGTSLSSTFIVEYTLSMSLPMR